MQRAILPLLLVSVIVTGCAATKRSKKVQYSGFLEDYAILTPGEDKYQASFRWVNSNADWSSYDKILLDPIEVWRDEEGKKHGVPREDVQRLADRIYRRFHQELSEDYQMVERPGPRTMRFEAALTTIGKRKPSLDVASTVLPPMIITSAVTDYVTGKPAFVGQAVMEFRVVDTETGELLAQGVDRRVGGKRLGKKHDSWADVDRITEDWCELIRYRFCTMRGGSDCMPPEGI